MLSVSIKAPAKINLFLRVLNKRKDKFHNLQTLFERIGLFDKITLTRRKDNRIVISSSNRSLPKGRGNLMYKAALLLKKKYGIKEGLGIFIDKNIPISAGLGGGSSDCATTLLGLNRLWKLKLTKKELLQMAKNLGSDVPFFVSNNSFSLATGRGEALKNLRNHIRLWHILIVPKIILSTKKVYAHFDKIEHKNEQEIRPSTASLTKGSRDVNIYILCLAKLGLTKRLRLLAKVNFNSLEFAAKRLAPQISRIKKVLYSLGIKYVGMSGSGPSVFGILNSGKEAKALRRKLARYKDWRTFVVRTC
ncbi:MAG: 4-(cytidine 5'-diphospho)-2-C-methyl-D-erythritol kinase [Candidatus Omnitrophota bacterium]